MARMNESWHICVLACMNEIWHICVMAHHVTCKESCHTRISHVTHMMESWCTWQWFMSRIWMSHITQSNVPCHAYKWVRSHIGMSRVKHMNESCHKYEWVMSDMKQSCHTYEWVMSQQIIPRQHGTATVHDPAPTGKTFYTQNFSKIQLCTHFE